MWVIRKPASGTAGVWGGLVLSLRKCLCARGLFISLTAIPRRRRGPPRGRPDRPARGRACRVAVMRRGDTGRRDDGAVGHRRPTLSVRLPQISERLARQGQAAAARSGRPRGGPSTKVLGIAVSDKETSIRQDLSLGTFVLSLRNRLCARGLFVSLTAIPRQRRGPPRGRPDRPARGRACRAAVMQRGNTGRRHNSAMWHRRLALRVRLPGKTERPARQGQAAAARSGRPRGGPSASALGIAVSDKKPVSGTSGVWGTSGCLRVCVCPGKPSD